MLINQHIMIVLGIIFAILFVISFFVEHQKGRALKARQEARRRRQQREWEEQFHLFSPVIRAAIRSIPEAQRTSVSMTVLLILSHKNSFTNKEKVDWKKEGF